MENQTSIFDEDNNDAKYEEIMDYFDKLTDDILAKLTPDEFITLLLR